MNHGVLLSLLLLALVACTPKPESSNQSGAGAASAQTNPVAKEPKSSNLPTWATKPGDLKASCENRVYEQYGFLASISIEGPPVILKEGDNYTMDGFVSDGKETASLKCIGSLPADFEIVPTEGYTDADIKRVLAQGKSPMGEFDNSAVQPSSDLQVISWRCEVASSDYLKVIGEVKNISPLPLENVAAYAEVHDDQGILAKNEALIDFKLLRPDETSPFEVLIDTGGRTGNCQLRFGVLYGEALSATFPN